MAEVRKLLDKGVIARTTPEFGDYISGVFTRDKKDNTKRLILNLKNFNQSVRYKHVKVESTQNLLSMIELGVFMASTDLKDAFFSVPIYDDHQKFLKIFVKDYYNCLHAEWVWPCNAYFYKNHKNIIHNDICHMKCHMSVVYVDGSYLQGKT